MAITSIQRRRNIEATVSVQSGVIVRNYVYEYVLLSDDDAEEAFDVLTYNQLPKVNKDVLTVDSAAVCKKKGPARRSNDKGNVWIVRTEWSTNTEESEENEEDQPDKPELMEDRIEWGGETIYVTVSEDIDGEPILNSAGDPFDDALERPLTVPTVTVTRFSKSNPKDDIDEFSNKLNGGSWNGYSARKALMGVIKAKKMRVNNERVWEVTYPIKIAPEGLTWDDILSKVLDAGPRYLDAGVKKPFTTQGRHVIGLLDGAGGEAAAGDEEFLTFKATKQISFAPLQIDIL